MNRSLLERCEALIAEFRADRTTNWHQLLSAQTEGVREFHRDAIVEFGKRIRSMEAELEKIKAGKRSFLTKPRMPYGSSKLHQKENCQ